MRGDIVSVSGASSNNLVVGGYSISNNTIVDIKTSSSKDSIVSRWDRFVSAFLNRFFSVSLKATIEKRNDRDNAKKLLWDLFHAKDQVTAFDSFNQLKNLVSDEQQQYFTMDYSKEDRLWKLCISVPQTNNTPVDDENADKLIEIELRIDFGGFKDGINEAISIVEKIEEGRPLAERELNAMVEWFIDGQDNSEQKISFRVESNVDDALTIQAFKLSDSAQEEVCDQFTLNISTKESDSNKAFKEKVRNMQSEAKNSGSKPSYSDGHDSQLRSQSPTLVEDVKRDGVTLHALKNQQTVNHSAAVAQPENNLSDIVEVTIETEVNEPQVKADNSLTSSGQHIIGEQRQTSIIEGKKCKESIDVLRWWHNNFPNNEHSLDAFEAMVSQFVVGCIAEHPDKSLNAIKMGTMQQGGVDIKGWEDERDVHIICLGDNKLLVVQRFKQFGSENNPMPDSKECENLCRAYWGQAIFLIDCNQEEKDECCKCLSVNVQKERYPASVNVIRG